jgi:hypothetical protein
MIVTHHHLPTLLQTWNQGKQQATLFYRIVGKKVRAVLLLAYFSQYLLKEEERGIKVN